MTAYVKEGASAIRPVTAIEVLRYRYHHGVNVGGCFVLEKWLTPSMYPAGADTSELAAVTASIDRYGSRATREKWEAHWSTMISDFDFEWLSLTAHCTTIRLPIGYFTLGSSYCKGTPFSSVAVVYRNAWSAVKKLVARAYSYGIGTLIDFHALPGGANVIDHSGTNSGKAELWNKPVNLDITSHCLLYLAQELEGLEGVVGLQICNEAVQNAIGMFDFYDRIITAIAQIDSSLPIYISDAWNLRESMDYLKGANSIMQNRSNPIIVDTHVFSAFTSADKAKAPSEIISDVSKKLKELDDLEGDICNRGAIQVVVGEYSCVMDTQTWLKTASSSRSSLITRYGAAQTQRWQQCVGGSFFWTLKMDSMDSKEWDFVQQTRNGGIKAPANLSLSALEISQRISAAKAKCQGLRDIAIKSNKAYWDHKSTTHNIEYWRFQNGWEIGYADAMLFFNMRATNVQSNIARGSVGGDKIGLRDVWIRKRILESGMRGPSIWQFEHGMRQGIKAFEDAAGI